MNWEQVDGNWNQVRGKIKAKWAKLTDKELDFIAGKKDQLVGRLQHSYGLTKEEATKEADEFMNKLH